MTSNVEHVCQYRYAWRDVWRDVTAVGEMCCSWRDVTAVGCSWRDVLQGADFTSLAVWSQMLQEHIHGSCFVMIGNGIGFNSIPWILSLYLSGLLYMAVSGEAAQLFNAASYACQRPCVLLALLNVCCAQCVLRSYFMSLLNVCCWRPGRSPFYMFVICCRLAQT